MIACKFFNHWKAVVDWGNSNKFHIDIISVTYIPNGGYCVFYKENSKRKEDIDLAIEIMKR